MFKKLVLFAFFIVPATTQAATTISAALAKFPGKFYLSGQNSKGCAFDLGGTSATLVDANGDGYTFDLNEVNPGQVQSTEDSVAFYVGNLKEWGVLKIRKTLLGHYRVTLRHHGMQPGMNYGMSCVFDEL